MKFELLTTFFFFFKILTTLNIIDPGFHRDRGIILRQLAESNKFLARRLFGEETISQVN